MGLPKLQIYGLHGVVLAHVFFNLPLATRLLLQGWDAIPQERFRLAASLGMESREVFRLLEWPMLKERLPAVMLVVFLICLSSFAVALTLGGGPAATTLELAIYQAFHLEFDLARAALLALMQLMLVLAVGMVALRPWTSGRLWRGAWRFAAAVGRGHAAFESTRYIGSVVGCRVYWLAVGGCCAAGCGADYKLACFGLERGFDLFGYCAWLGQFCASQRPCLWRPREGVGLK